MRVPVPKFKCPACGSVVPNEYKAGQPLTCAACHKQLQPSRRYLNWAFSTALAIALAISFFLGLRGLWLFVATLVLWLPVNFLWTFLYVRVFPPRFEPYVPRSTAVNR